MNMLKKVAVAGLLSLAVGGCQTDTRPEYFAPRVANADVAVLKGAHGTHIDGIDHTAVGDQDFTRQYGWNAVPVSPGVHELRVVVHARNGQAYISQPWTLNFRCEKGHTYEFRQNDDYGDKLRVVDVTTDQTMIISG